MGTVLPRPGDRPSYKAQLAELNKMEADLEPLLNLTALSPPALEDVEMLCLNIR